MLWNRLLFLLLIFNLSDSRIDKHHEYSIEANNKKFLASINLKEKIQISLTESGIIISSYYYTELTLDSLCKYNKIFKQYDTLEEAYSCIIKLFEKEKIKIYDRYDEFSLGFIMNSASCDNEEVIIKFKKKNMNKDEINEKVRIETNSLLKEIKTLKIENKELKELVKNLERRLIYPELKDQKIDTKILNNKSNLLIIINEFKEKYKKSVNGFNLLYRASEYGEQYENMNSRIKNNDNLLMIFQTIKGIKFGIFLNKQLNYNNNNNNNYNYNYNSRSNKYGYYYNKDENFNTKNPKSFIFSLDNNKIFYLDNEDKIICFNERCPSNKQAIEYLINIYSINLLSKSKKINFINNISNISSNDINGEDKYFNLQELEIFQVSYTNI